MANANLKATALEPTRLQLADLPLRKKFIRLIPVYGIPILTILLISIFSIILPETFPTWLNFRSILSDKGVIAILALASTLPMMAGRIDLTVGYGIVLWHVLAISLQAHFGLPWWAAVVVVIGLAGSVGAINGILVEVAKIDAFIATLGTGTLLYATALWHTGGRQVLGTLPPEFFAINDTSVFGIPIGAFYVLAITIALWLFAERLPIGRQLYAIGANQKAAELSGVPVRSRVILVFVLSGVLTGFAGILLASKLRIGQASVGLEFLLPALVAAFLGSTTIRPGRVNFWGTIWGVAVLSVGIAGIQQFGADFYVEPLFNGLTLLVSILLAGYGQSRQARASKG